MASRAKAKGSSAAANKMHMRAHSSSASSSSSLCNADYREKNELKQKLTLLLLQWERGKEQIFATPSRKPPVRWWKRRTFQTFPMREKLISFTFFNLYLSKRSKRGGRRHLADESWSLLVFFPRVVALFEITSNPLGFVCFASRCISMPTTTNRTVRYATTNREVRCDFVFSCV